MSKQIREYLGSAMFLIFGVALMLGSRSITTFIENDVGPAFMPKLVGISIVVLSLIKLIINIKDKTDTKEDSKSKEGIEKGGIYTLVLVFAYFLVLNKLGFIISTAIYLFLQIQILSKYDEHDIKTKLIISIVVPVVVFFLFTKGFQLMLPKGIL